MAHFSATERYDRLPSRQEQNPPTQKYKGEQASTDSFSYNVVLHWW